MKTLQLVIFFSILFSSYTSQGQRVVRAGLTGDNFDTASRGETRAIDFNMSFVREMFKDGTIDENIEGSQYFNEAFLPSKILFEGVAYDKGYLARYNAFEDLIELHKGEYNDALLQDEKISCMIGNSLYSYKTFASKRGNNTDTGYLKLVAGNSHINIYVQQYIKFKEAVVAKSSMTSSFPAKFVPMQTFYFQDEKMPAALPITKKSALTMFPGITKDQVKSYIKKNKIDITVEKDLISLFKFYTSLVE